MHNEDSRARRILRLAPSLVSFSLRVHCLRQLIAQDREEVRSARAPVMSEEVENFLGSGRTVQVRFLYRHHAAATPQILELLPIMYTHICAPWTLLRLSCAANFRFFRLSMFDKCADDMWRVCELILCGCAKIV